MEPWNVASHSEDGIAMNHSTDVWSAIHAVEQRFFAALDALQWHESCNGRHAAICSGIGTILRDYCRVIRIATLNSMGFRDEEHNVMQQSTDMLAGTHAMEQGFSAAMQALHCELQMMTSYHSRVVALWWQFHTDIQNLVQTFEPIQGSAGPSSTHPFQASAGVLPCSGNADSGVAWLAQCAQESIEVACIDGVLVFPTTRDTGATASRHSI